VRPTSPGGEAAAVIVGLDCITGLQAARILRARGVPVYGVAHDPAHFAARTNACRMVVQADTRGPGLIPALLALAGHLEQPAVLIPCSDDAVLRISAERRRLESDYRIALPDHEVVERLMHKPSMTRYARERGFRVPASFGLRTDADLERCLEGLRLPCVLKPALKDPRWFSHTSAKAFLVRSRDELVRRWRECRRWSDELVVQEWIEGPESALYSCNCYFDRSGEPQVAFVARKIRQWPPGTGTSALGVECRADEVREESLRLFRELGFRGLGYVEMKRDARSGEFYLIEPNVGRPTGRSAICEAGGVELLYTLYCDLVGRALPARRQQRYTGAKWIYLRHDLQAALHGLRRGELDLGGWLRSLRGPKAYAVLSLRDPLPFLYDLRKTLLAIAGRPMPRRTAEAALAPVCPFPAGGSHG
jgi:D-aspartate ligase